MKKGILVILIMFVSLSLFAGLGVSYNEIMSNDFNKYFNMKYRPLDNGTPRYIGQYSVILLEVIGEKNNPISTSFTFEAINDLETLTYICTILKQWLQNSMVHSSYAAYEWVVSTWENNPNTASFQKNKTISGYHFTMIWKGGVMFINVEGPKNYTVKTNNNQLPTTVQSKKIIINSDLPEGGVVSFDQSEWDINQTKKITEDKSFMIYAKENDGYIFKGWYKNQMLLSENKNFSFKLKYYTVSTTILTAKFIPKGNILVLNKTCGINEPIDIIIRGNNIESLSSFDIYISYDDEYLDFDSLSENAVVFDTFLNRYKIFAINESEKGEIKISGGTLAKYNNKKIPNDTFFILRFITKKKIGNSIISILDKSKIMDSNYKIIDLDFHKGKVEIK